MWDVTLIPNDISSVVFQAFTSLPSQQVSSSSAALSTQAEPSQPVITDSTWEEYQQAQTHWEKQQQWAAFQFTAPFYDFNNNNTWSLLLCVCVCEEQQPAVILQLLMNQKWL